MNIPSKFDGTIYFGWHTKYHWVQSSTHDYVDYEDYIPLGSVDVDVSFDTKAATLATVSALEKQIEEEKAQSYLRIQQMKDRINSLLAIESAA